VIHKARDILGLEIVPLGPLNGKSFMTSISPWVITLDALSPFAALSPPRDSPVAPYLKDPASNGTYAVELRAEVIVDGTSTRICTAKLEWMYWSFRHIFAHQCIGGCGVSSGDIIATGTASGTTPDSLGCLLEMTMAGKKPFQLQGGSKRAFLEDGDSVRITGFAGTEGDGVGFGDCIGQIVPAPALKAHQNGSL
jgi:fumarylacetoacetase